jgi:hypothetical protein
MVLIILISEFELLLNPIIFYEEVKVEAASASAAAVAILVPELSRT